MLTTDQDLASLRRRIATGDYAVNASNVADSIVRKLKEINRARRLLNDPGDDRTPDGDAAGDQAPGSRRPPQR